MFIRPHLPRLDHHNLNQGVVQDRINQFRTRVRKDHYDVEAHYGLGVAYFSLGLTDEAITQLKDAATLTPENPDIQTQLAVVLFKAYEAGDHAVGGELDRRIDRALLLAPDNLDALFVRSHFLRDQGRYQEAVDCLNPVYSRWPREVAPNLNTALGKLGDWQLMQGKWDGLPQTWEQLARVSPDTASALILRFLTEWEKYMPSSVKVKRSVSNVVQVPVVLEDPVPAVAQEPASSEPPVPAPESKVIPAAPVGRRIVNALLAALGWFMIAFILFVVLTSITSTQGVISVGALCVIGAPLVGAIRSWRRWSRLRTVTVRPTPTSKPATPAKQVKKNYRNETRTQLKDVRIGKKELLSGAEGLDALQVAAGQTLKSITDREVTGGGSMEIQAMLAQMKKRS